MSEAIQNPEDVFELPAYLQGIKPLDRERATPVDALVFADHVAVLETRRQNRATHEAAIADAVGTWLKHRVPATVLAEADFADLATLTPFQAAVVEIVLNPWGKECSVIDLWGGARGLGFALAAFIEFCQVTNLGDKGFLAGRTESDEPRPDTLRLLELVRTAPDADHAEVLAAAERLRDGEPSAVTRAVTSFLFPEQPEWFWADLVAADKGMLNTIALLPSVSTPEQASALGEQLRRLPRWEWAATWTIERTFLAVAGPSALPFYLAWCDSGHGCTYVAHDGPSRCDVHNHCLDMMVRIPSDEAMTELVRRVEQEGVPTHLDAAVTRFPQRASRVLAASEPSEKIDRLLAVLSGPDADADSESVLGELPEILAAPPWRDKKRKRAKPVVVEGLTPPAGVRVAWLPGEREHLLALDGAGWVPEQGWDAVLTEIHDVPRSDLLETYFAAYGPEELVRAELATWQPPLHMVTNRAQTFVARYELLALPSVLPLTRFPAVRARLLQPFVSAEIAAIMADGLARLRTARSLAAAWLRRHPEDAVLCLVPTALGKPGKTRQNTVAALRFLEAEGIDVVAIGSRAYGEAAGVALKEVLADRGLDAYPRTTPEPPQWARHALLPVIRLKDSGTPLPRSAALAVVEMLMFSSLDAPYPGLEIVKEVCDASSLAEFALALFEGWELADDVNDGGHWAMDGLGLLGDESTVTRLQKLIREWRVDYRMPHVFDGFEVLATIGGDRALTTLNTFANMAWTAKAKRTARARLDDVAHRMGLTAEQLTDRMIPTFDLDAQGTIEVDYGTRRFTVAVDDLLRLVVTDESGAVLRALPKPGKRDDAEVAPAAYKGFSTLKTEIQRLAREQRDRLERAMIDRHRWAPADFIGHVVPHLLLGRIVRRLVWGVYAEDGELLGAFRIAEDGSFADVDDAHYEVPEGGLIGVVHPVELGRTLGRWSEVFADYEILQPFDQLVRPPLALNAAERAGWCFARPYIFPNATASGVGTGEARIPPSWFGQLLARGWQPGAVGAERLWSRLRRPLGDGRYVMMELVPGLEAGAVPQSQYQAIKMVWLSATGEDAEVGSDAVRLSELDDDAASVILRDLER
jgi:hypothetical protein